MSKQPLSEDQQFEYAMELAMELGPTATQTQALRATLELLKDKGITSAYNWYSMILLVERHPDTFPATDLSRRSTAGFDGARQ
jgi:hypothetical protein